MNKFFETITESFLNNPKLLEEQIKAFLNAKHDGNAQAVINRLKATSKTSDEFASLLIKELYGNESIFLFELLKDTENISDVIVTIGTNQGLRTENFRELASVMEKFSKSDFVQKMNYPKLAENVINDTTISIKKVREEIGMSQPTFKKWLDYYFPDGQFDEVLKKKTPKYHGKHKITSKDYLLITSYFLGVPPKEHKTDVKEIVDRIASGLTVSKDDIKKETKKRSAALSEAIDFINETERNSNPIPKDVDKFPYAIALEIMDAIRL